jgi:hypothetical protein
MNAVKKFNGEVKEMELLQAAKARRYDRKSISDKRSNDAVDMIEGLISSFRPPKALQKLMTIEGENDRPYILRLEEA